MHAQTWERGPHRRERKFIFIKFIFVNIRRRFVLVLKLYRGLILTKKVGIKVLKVFQKRLFLKEMIDGDFADMCTENFPLMLMGAEQRD